LCVVAVRSQLCTGEKGTGAYVYDHQVENNASVLVPVPVPVPVAVAVAVAVPVPVPATAAAAAAAAAVEVPTGAVAVMGVSDMLPLVSAFVQAEDLVAFASCSCLTLLAVDNVNWQQRFRLDFNASSKATATATATAGVVRRAGRVVQRVAQQTFKNACN
jgi:hypothetical protein